MATARWILILAGASILPSCAGDHHGWLTIRNEGAEAASFWIEEHYWGRWPWTKEHEGSVLPNESVTFRFKQEDLDRLELRIYRSSDFLKLFEDSWDSDDLDDVNYMITLTVNP